MCHGQERTTIEIQVDPRRFDYLDIQIMGLTLQEIRDAVAYARTYGWFPSRSVGIADETKTIASAVRRSHERFDDQ